MISISKIAELISGQVEGNSDLLIKDICELKGGVENCISFIAHPKYTNLFTESEAEAVIVGLNIDLPENSKTVIRVDNPPLAFNKVTELFRPKHIPEVGIHDSAVISNSVTMGENVSISANVVIEDEAVIGNNVYIGSNTTIGRNSTIGDNSCIMTNVAVYHDVNIGSHVHIDSGTAIGADGFGMVTHNGIHHRTPHTGTVEIEDHVAIGTNCCIDRGTINCTRIGEHSKLDNMIQVSHNVVIGKGCIIAGQSGVAGSTILGNYVTMAGQSGVVGHIQVGDNCVIATNTLVTKTLKAGSFVSGNPAREHLKRKKQEAVINQLPELLKRVRALEQELDKIKKD
ncbi:MAG: UDP-3-O-(3-hydroxymyristoyl)glucosamine N-acyltransferase [Candidatus Marinimicrobia bacterium]|nr:UDP-3-O-(3-hydroxymyristoyl)glucosamine N-acyltransferase [Candidatus Neomarinimicrobiota bacterium]